MAYTEKELIKKYDHLTIIPMASTNYTLFGDFVGDQISQLPVEYGSDWDKVLDLYVSPPTGQVILAFK
jgi:hypothetical protein